MTIARALKEKNKKVTKLSQLWDRLHRYNVANEGETRPYSSQDTWNEIEKLTKELVELKTKIHQASDPVRLDIFMLSELKSKAQRLRGMNTNSGTYRDRYSDSAPIVQVAEFDVLWKDSTLEQIEAQIEETQEFLDKFNHTANI
jgi:hypothetical protein